MSNVNINQTKADSIQSLILKVYSLLNSTKKTILITKISKLFMLKTQLENAITDYKLS